MTSPAFLLFGAHGDLATRMLWPSLFRLHCDGSLPADMAIYGLGRAGDSDELHAQLRRALADELNDGNRGRRSVPGIGRRPHDPAQRRRGNDHRVHKHDGG